MADLNVRGLAQYLPFDEAVEGSESVHDDLVGAACQSAGGRFDSLEDCRTFIKKTWRIDLELDEVREARRRLVEGGLASKEGGGLALTAGASKRLEEERVAWEEAEQVAIGEWEASLRTEYPLLTDDQVAALRGQVRPWLDQVIARHGAEASLLLFPEDERAVELVQTLTTGAGLHFLPSLEPELEAIRASAFRLLVHEPTKAQRDFLARLLNVGFHQTALSLDPSAAPLVKVEARKTILYLDTNFLYALLGVNGPTEAYAGKRLVEICKELGYSLRVTPWTIDELRTSIRSGREAIGNARRSQKAATVLAHVAGDTGLEAAYWRELRDKGTRPDDFFDKLDHFMRLFEGLGIEEHPEGCPEVEADIERIRDYSSPLEAVAGVGVKHRVVIEHDAKMRILIENLRGQAKVGGYTDVRYWFLTASSNQLPAYARLPIGDAERPQFPFCVLSSTWAQVARALLPRTDDLAEVMVGLLTSPYIGHKPSPRDAQLAAVNRVVSRMETMEDVSPAMAIALLNDRAMASVIGREVDEEEVDRLVEAGLSKKAEELERRLEESAQLVVDAQRDKQRAEEAAAAAAAELEAGQEGARIDVERARQERARALANAEEAARLKDEREEQRRILEGELSTSKETVVGERDARTTAEERVESLTRALAIVLMLATAALTAALILLDVVNGRLATIVLVAAACAFGYMLLLWAFERLAKQVKIAFAAFSLIATTAAYGRRANQAPSNPVSRLRKSL